MSKESNFISAIIYVDAASTQAGSFIGAIADILKENFQKYEIICVDDRGSQAGDKLYQEIKKDHSIEVFTVIHMAPGHRGGKQGREKCMVAGRDLSIGDYVFEFDSCIMNYDHKLIMEAYHATQEGFDIVSASKEGKKPAGSYIFYKIYNKFSNSPVNLDSESFRILSRRAVNRAESYSKIMSYRKAVYAFSGFKMTSIKYRPNKAVQEPPDKLRWEIGSDAIVLFTNFAYKVSLAFSIAMSFFMLLFGMYVIAVYFGSNRPVEGWTPLMGVICFGFLAVFSLLAVMFKYLDMLIRLEFENQQYVVSSIDKL